MEKSHPRSGWFVFYLGRKFLKTCFQKFMIWIEYKSIQLTLSLYSFILIQLLMSYFKSLLNKGETCRGCVTAKPALSSDQLEELRDFLEELDLVPLCALPSEVWPLVYDFQQNLFNGIQPFETPIERDFMAELSRRVRSRRSKRISSNDQFKIEF